MTKAQEGIVDPAIVAFVRIAAKAQKGSENPVVDGWKRGATKNQKELAEEIVDRLKTENKKYTKNEITTAVLEGISWVALIYWRRSLVPGNETKIRNIAKKLSKKIQEALNCANLLPATIEDLYLRNDMMYLKGDFVPGLWGMLERSRLLEHVSGPSTNRNLLKGLCAHSALQLVKTYSSKPINGSQDGEHQIIAGLFHDAMIDAKDSNLKRACDAARKAKDNPFLASYLSTDIRRKLRKSVPTK